MVGSFGYIYIHLAYFGTLSAGNAFVFVYFHSEKRHLVKQCIKCTERTQPLAERSVEKYTQYDYRNQYAKLPRKERTQCGTDSRINGGKRDCPLEYSLRTKILTEKGSPIPTSFVMSIGSKPTAKSKTAYFMYVSGFSFLVESFLSVSYVTVPEAIQTDTKTADKTPEQNSYQYEESCDII